MIDEALDVSGRSVPEQIEFTCMVAEGFVRINGDPSGLVVPAIEAARIAARLYSSNCEVCYIPWLAGVRELCEENRHLVGLLAPDEWGTGKEEAIPRLVAAVLPGRTAARIYREWSR